MKEDQTIYCSCCGCGIPPADDEGAMCKGCGGDPLAKKTSRKLGDAAMMFYRARIPIVRTVLDIEQKKTFDGWPLWKKIAWVDKALEKGWLSW